MLTVIRDIDKSDNNPLKDLPESAVLIVPNDNVITIGTLSKGMTSGKTSVGIIIPLPDGRMMFAETSLALAKIAFGMLNEIPE